MDLVKIESQVILSGPWKNFEDLEESLSMDELSAIANALIDRDNNNREFLAALKGIKLNDSTGEVEQDIVEFDPEGMRAGFGIGMGLGYTEE